MLVLLWPGLVLEAPAPQTPSAAQVLVSLLIAPVLIMVVLASRMPKCPGMYQFYSVPMLMVASIEQQVFMEHKGISACNTHVLLIVLQEPLHGLEIHTRAVAIHAQRAIIIMASYSSTY